MELRTTLLTIAILAAGFGLGRLTAPEAAGPGGGDAQEPDAARGDDSAAVRLEGRPTTGQPAEEPSTADLAERLDAIEQLLLATHLPAGDEAHDAKVVERIKEVWIPVVRESLVQDRFAQAKAGVALWLRHRIAEHKDFIETERARGGATMHLQGPLRELERRLADVESARTPDALVAVLTESPDGKGDMAREDALALVYGYVYPD